MSNVIGNGVTLAGFHNEAWKFTFILSGAITRADVGKVVTQDPTAANTVKLAGDGDFPLGILSSYENRIQEGIITGTVGLKDSRSVPYTGALAVGDSIEGSATPGVVQKADVANHTRVWEVDATNHTAVVMFL
jgi:hypothetical protein